MANVCLCYLKLYCFLLWVWAGFFSTLSVKYVISKGWEGHSLNGHIEHDDLQNVHELLNNLSELGFWLEMPLNTFII